MKLYLASSFCQVINKLDFKGKKKVAFIPTAADPYKSKPFVDADYNAFVKKGFLITIIDIKNKTELQLFNILKNFEIIFVSGGNSFYLLEKMNACNFVKIINALLKKGLIYIGSSAGSIVACPNIEYIKEIDDPNEAKNLKNYIGLNLVDFYIIPHYGKDKYAEKCKQILNKNKSLKTITLQDDEVIIVSEKRYKKF